MDEDMKNFLTKIEKRLQDIRPAGVSKDWFRTALASALHPLNRRRVSVGREMRRVVEQLIAASRYPHTELVDWVRDRIRSYFDLRYGEGSYDRWAGAGLD